jgi:hypothetical protein
MLRTALFLDIDGVLNSTRYWWTNKPLPMNKAGAIDPDAVARLNRIVSAVDPLVVLSSSWRSMGYDTVQRMLAERGFVGRLIDQTPMKDGCPRCAEIDEWLHTNRARWDRFVVLDDDVDAWSDDGPFSEHGLYAATNYLHGIVDEHIPLITGFLTA